MQGVDHVLPAAQRLLRQFAFIPYARLDDVMVSYAPPGGGVGPHFDSYDVFLVQGDGRRRWRVGPSAISSCVAGRAAADPAALPAAARVGVAIRGHALPAAALRARRRRAHRLHHLLHRLSRAGRRGSWARGSWNSCRTGCSSRGMYEDPDLAPQRHPAELGAAMVRKVRRMLGGIRWNGGDVADFLGCYLTEPKAHVVFARPRAPARAARASPPRLRGAACGSRSRRGCSSAAARFSSTASRARRRATGARLSPRLADRRELAPGSRLDRAADAACFTSGTGRDTLFSVTSDE